MAWTHPLLLVSALGMFVVLALGARLRRDTPTPSLHSEMNPRNVWRQYYARFALLVLAFVVFDMEMAFMYPWAVAFRKVGLTAFADMLVFVAILGVALTYMWRSGVLELEQPRE